MILVASIVALVAFEAAAETITGAQYSDPVVRYGHFALGRPHEYARVTVTTDAGRTLALQLPEDEVFEDLAPRLVQLEAGAPQELLTIVSQRDSGARLALIGLRRDRLELTAQSPAIGTPMRWLNPVGVADLDGDGRAEIAAVITPHIGGTLKVYRRAASELVEIAALTGFSNHVYGSPELALSAPVSIGGRMHLLVPDTSRMHLRAIALEGGRLLEARRCALPAPLTGAIRVTALAEIALVLSTGRKRVILNDCTSG